MATIGVDLGGTKIMAVRIEQGAVVEQAKRSTPRVGGPDDVLDVIAEAVARVDPEGRQVDEAVDPTEDEEGEEQAGQPAGAGADEAADPGPDVDVVDLETLAGPLQEERVGDERARDGRRADRRVVHGSAAAIPDQAGARQTALSGRHGMRRGARRRSYRGSLA